MSSAPPHLRPRSGRFLFPRPGLTFTLQHLYVHLPLQGCRVEAINHLWAGPGIAGQSQRVDCAAIEQAKHDAAVAKAIE